MFVSSVRFKKINIKIYSFYCRQQNKAGLLDLIMRSRLLSSLRQSSQISQRLFPMTCAANAPGISTNKSQEYGNVSNNRRSFHKESNQRNSHGGKNEKEWGKIGSTLGALTVVGYLVWRKTSRDVAHLDAQAQRSERSKAEVGHHEKVVAHLPSYSKDEVAEHYDESKKIWVSFRRGVYDVTEFVKIHPGGSRILMAAGGSLEPFWELYPVHQKSDVFAILEKYRIGNLNEEDVVEAQEAVDHFKGEPSRHPVFIRRSEKPFNGETPPSLLTEKFHTPNEVFYVRNHLPVPQVDAKSYRLEIEGISLKEKSLSLEELKRFPKVSISATIQCGGNRRTEMGKDKSVAGLAWTGGAIGNAKWSGARLIDVLKTAQFKPESYKNPKYLHIKFDGLDTDQSGECYGASVPLSYLLDGNFDAILAYEMNDKPLPIDHGFPIRVILPGIVGARSVKWLSRICISDEESQSPWQQRDYKIFSPSVTLETVDFSAAPAISDTPVTSYLCSHADGDRVKKGPVQLQGYAFSGGGRNIVRVEISCDKGNTWHIARISSADKSTGSGATGTKNWSWVLWNTTINIQKDTEIWVKAVDSGYNQQPEDFKNIWNYRGLLATAYHKVHLKV